MDDITTTVVPNDRGTEDVQILVNESDGATLAPAIEAAATDALKVHMRRKEFSGKIQISLPGSIPVAQRKEIPPVIERLRELCAQLSTGQSPYRVTLMYRRDPVSAASVPASAASAPASAAQLAAAASPQGPSALRASSVTRTRIWLGAGILLAIIIVLGLRYLAADFLAR